MDANLGFAIFGTLGMLGIPGFTLFLGGAGMDDVRWVLSRRYRWQHTDLRVHAMRKHSELRP